MILDMNIGLGGIDDEFLEDLDELIEDTRVEYFVINPKNKEELNKTQMICERNQRFKYTLPIEYFDFKDKNCVALLISHIDELKLVEQLPVVIDSQYLDKKFIDILNSTLTKGIILNAKESDNKLENFVYAVSYDSINKWTNKGMMNTDYNKLGLQSNYPNYSYDEFVDGLLKDMSDMTFRAEQTIAAGGTRTILKTFGLL